MRNQKGKVNIGSFLIIVMLVYGAFAAFKIISSRVTKTQIKSEIIEKFGAIIGMDFTPEKGEEIIRDIMTAHKLYSEPVGEGEENEDESGDKNVKAKSDQTKIAVELRQNGTKIRFFVEYIDEINLLLFKTKARYSIDEEMFNYN